MTDEVELLLRQVRPDWLHNDLIGSQAFFDAECSVARGSKVTADAAWRSHTSRGLQSAGAWTSRSARQATSASRPGTIPLDPTAERSTPTST